MSFVRGTYVRTRVNREWAGSGRVWSEEWEGEEWVEGWSEEWEGGEWDRGYGVL